MSRDLPTIASNLRRWLLAVTAGAFLLIGAVVVFLQYHMNLRDTRELLRLTLQDVAMDIQSASDADLLRMTQRVASAYENDPTVDLGELKRLYGVSEINVVDEKGVVVKSTDDRFVGYDMSRGDQSAKFLELLHGKDTLTQPLRRITYDGVTLRKYAGIALKSGGFIQAGYSREQYKAALADDILDIAGNRRILEDGLVFILDSDQKLVSMRNDEHDSLNPALLSMARQLNEPGKMELLTDENEVGFYWMYNTLEDYRIAVMVSRKEALESLSSAVLTGALLGLALFIVILTSIQLLMARMVVKPVDEMDEALSAITKGDLDRRLNIRITQEFARISDGVNATVDALKEHIAREAARIDEELAYGRRIQEAALPALSDAFTTHPAFGLYAVMDTAREVGGDFYDFYLKDDHTLALEIADVSGKGIPAAMFMMRGKTTLRNCVELEDEIGGAMTRANERLLEGNDAGMFITSWVGLIDLKTGVMRFANAGHNPPVLIRGGRAKLLDQEPDLILGIMDGVEYTSQTMALEPGDLLLLYTDGVTEAANPQKKLYGEARLLETLNGVRPGEDADICRTVCDRVQASVEAFADGAPQADDITKLCLHYRGFGGSC